MEYVTMKNEEKAKEIAIEKSREWIDQEYGKISTEEDCYKSAMAMADFKNAQPISELGGWHTELPTKDCTVLLYITEQTLTVSRWNSPNKMFYDNVFVYSKPIKKWIKWKLI